MPTAGSNCARSPRPTGASSSSGSSSATRWHGVHAICSPNRRAGREPMTATTVPSAWCDVPARRCAGLRRRPAARSRRTRSRLSTSTAPAATTSWRMFLWHVVVVALEAAAWDPHQPRRTSCSSSSDWSDTRWHHRRPRHHQRGWSTSTATLRSLSHGRPSATGIAGAVPRCAAAAARRHWSAVSDEVELRIAWASIAPPNRRSAEVFDDLVGRHRQPHRRYHGLRHVVWVLRHTPPARGRDRRVPRRSASATTPPSSRRRRASTTRSTTPGR